MELKVDPTRKHLEGVAPTGVFVRARDPDDERIKSVDIITLTRTSLLMWMDEQPNRAASVVLILLGHPRT